MRETSFLCKEGNVHLSIKCWISKSEVVSLSLSETIFFKIRYLRCTRMVLSCLKVETHIDDPNNVTIPSASISLASYSSLVSLLSTQHLPIEIKIYTSPLSDIGIVDKVLTVFFLHLDNLCPPQLRKTKSAHHNHLHSIPPMSSMDTGKIQRQNPRRRFIRNHSPWFSFPY